MGMAGRLDAYIGKVSELLSALAGWAVFVMMGIVVADIFMVSTRLGSFVVKVELVEMLMIVIVFGAFAYADILEKHVTATMFISRLSSKWRSLCDAFSYSIGLFVCVIFTWQLILYAQRMTAIRKTCLSSDLPYYPFTWFAVAGFILMDVRYSIRIMRNIYNFFGEKG
jgi:TRAP-type C4-dicarboxylate transport system permease small subunit